MIEALSLDQLRVFAAVADAGSFTAAGKRLGRAQSAMSEAVANLEARLGVALFDRSAKRPKPTERGRALLADARAALAAVDAMRARAAALRQGLEAELRVVASVLVPPARLAPVLAAFEAEFPAVSLTLSIEEIGAAPAAVLEGRADIGLTGRPGLPPGEGLAVLAAGSVETVAVAAPSHPLARAGVALDDAALRAHRQLVPTVRAGAAAHRNVLGREAWRVADLGARRALLLAGLGWATIPRDAVEADLAAGRLAALPLASRGALDLVEPLVAVRRADRAPGPAASWLLAKLGEGSWSRAGGIA